MMRKRLLAAMAAAIVTWMISEAGPAQVGSAGPTAGGACCRMGVPSIPADQECVLLHQVGPGENLHILAAYYYGDARAWRRIYNLNRKLIKNPNKIVVGQVLRIEVPPCWTARFDLQEFLRLEQRRLDILKRAPGERPREIRKREEVETKVTVSLEEEEAEKPGETPAPEEGGGGVPTIEIEEVGGER